MLRMYLEDVVGKNRANLDPHASFRIEGSSLRDPHGSVIAVYKSGLWEAGEMSYRVAVVDGPAMVQLEDRGEHSRPFGPFGIVRLLDGTVWASDLPDGVIARLDENSGEWQTTGDARRWPTVVLFAPPS